MDSINSNMYTDRKPNKTTRAAIEDVDNNRYLTKPFDSIKELMEVLNAEDRQKIMCYK